MTWVARRASELLVQHGLAPGWALRFDHARTRFGQCDHRRQTISISRVLAARANDDGVEQVLLHEIAHALAGARAGHGPVWLARARAIGYRGGRTHQVDASADLAKWHGVCPHGHEVLRFRRPRKLVSCAHCDPRFNQAYLIEWSERTLTARP